MNLLPLPALLTALLLCAGTFAQAAEAPRAPSGGSPEIAADHKVTFRLKAPQANEVSVAGQAVGKTAMAKDESGLWSATVGPVEAGVWEYSFSVDGVQMVDPGNPAIKPQRAPRTSILHIPNEPPAPWDFRAAVPHGSMHWHDYFAPSLGRARRLHVYTPPGYERNPVSEYPVLYLVHGFGDNDAAWSVHGKANWILDNLLADQKARPMIVVMPDGHPLAPEGSSRENYGQANLDAFEKELMTEIIPMIEATYRVQNDPAQRALAGLSMGGGHTVFTGLQHLDRFGWLGSFSAGLPGDDRLNALLASPEAPNAALKLFWIACGKNDFLIERNRKFHELLDSRGIHHTWSETDGDHSWPVWRRYLTEFAPLLFVEGK